jgi:mono/diheme cytochrome c family protein
MIASLLFLVACGGSSTDTASVTGDTTAGADVYATSCAACHGASGEGGTGPAMADEVPGKTDAELEDIVLNGEGSMPAVSLGDQDLADLLAYLRAEFG